MIVSEVNSLSLPPLAVNPILSRLTVPDGWPSLAETYADDISKNNGWSSSCHPPQGQASLPAPSLLPGPTNTLKLHAGIAVGRRGVDHAHPRLVLDWCQTGRAIGVHRGKLRAVLANRLKRHLPPLTDPEAKSQ